VNTVRLTPAARHDLSSIWDYTAERWDVSQAETYIGELRAAIERVAEQPERGLACDEIREGYRRYAVGSHSVFYVTSELGVDVIRILHQRMEPSKHF
jgi:toxin ParE1/3/4